MKKVCYVLPNYDPDTDTHFAYLYDFLKKASRKLDIFLVVEKSSGQKISGNFKRVYYQKFKFWPLRVIELASVLKIARALGYRNFYVHYSYPGAILAGLVARFSFGKSLYWNCASSWSLKQRFRSRLGLWLALKSTQCLITGTEGLKQQYAKEYRLAENKIKVMPNWVNRKNFLWDQNEKQELLQKYKIPKGSRVLLFVHRISERKGADFLLPILKKLGPTYTLLVAGQGPYGTKLAEEVERSDFSGRVKILGRVPNREISELYALADIFLMPSREEGFPRVLLEAMAAGIPFVAFDTGGVREISPPSAQEFILPVGEIEEFARKTGLLLNNPEVYTRFKDGEKEKVKEFSQKKALSVFLKLFS